MIRHSVVYDTYKRYLEMFILYIKWNASAVHLVT